MTLSIVVPTVHFRQEQLVRTVAAYERLTPTVEIEWIVEIGHADCGSAWNAGARRASGEVLHMTADDLEPASPEWLPAAVGALNDGFVPVGWVHEPTGAGTFGRDFPRVPICRREWWTDVPTIHYFSDNAFGDLMVRAGHGWRVAEGFDFVHRRSLIGRNETPERVASDRKVYEQAMSDLHQLS